MRQDQPTDLWIGTYASILDACGVLPGAKVADLACGTGDLTLALARAGYAVVGADLSEEMLSLARDKAAEAGFHAIPWIRQDLAELSLPGRYQAILSACDGVNYLTEDGRLASFLRRAYGLLEPGGVLAFDLSAPGKLLPMAGQIYTLDEDEGAYIWTNTLEEKAVLRMELTLFLRREDGAFTRHEEVHRQRAYTKTELESALREAGFSGVSVTAAFDGSPIKKNTQRYLVTARKGRGKEKHGR